MSSALKSVFSFRELFIDSVIDSITCSSTSSCRQEWYSRHNLYTNIGVLQSCFLRLRQLCLCGCQAHSKVTAEVVRAWRTPQALFQFVHQHLRLALQTLSNYEQPHIFLNRYQPHYTSWGRVCIVTSLIFSAPTSKQSWNRISHPVIAEHRHTHIKPGKRRPNLYLCALHGGLHCSQSLSAPSSTLTPRAPVECITALQIECVILT